MNRSVHADSCRLSQFLMHKALYDLDISTHIWFHDVACENVLEMLHANCNTECTAFPGHWSEFPNVFGGEQANPQNFPLV
jgi:hypothetical protein